MFIAPDAWLFSQLRRSGMGRRTIERSLRTAMSLLTELIRLLPLTFYKHGAPTELRACENARINPHRRAHQAGAKKFVLRRTSLSGAFQIDKVNDKGSCVRSMSTLKGLRPAATAR